MLSMCRIYSCSRWGNVLPARGGIAGLVCAELAEELRLELYGCRKFYTVKVYIEGLFACIVIQTSSMAAHWCHLLAGENERTPIIQEKKIQGEASTSVLALLFGLAWAVGRM